MCDSGHVWKSGDNLQELVHSFYHVCPSRLWPVRILTQSHASLSPPSAQILAGPSSWKPASLAQNSLSHLQNSQFFFFSEKSRPPGLQSMCSSKGYQNAGTCLYLAYPRAVGALSSFYREDSHTLRGYTHPGTGIWVCRKPTQEGHIQYRKGESQRRVTSLTGPMYGVFYGVREPRQSKLPLGATSLRGSEPAHTRHSRSRCRVAST